MADYHITNFPRTLRIELKVEAQKRYTTLRNLTVAIILNWFSDKRSLAKEFAKIQEIAEQRRDYYKQLSKTDKENQRFEDQKETKDQKEILRKTFCIKNFPEDLKLSLKEIGRRDQIRLSDLVEKILKEWLDSQELHL